MVGKNKAKSSKPIMSNVSEGKNDISEKKDGKKLQSEKEYYCCVKTDQGFVEVEDKAKIPAVIADLIVEGKKNFEVMTFASKDEFEAFKDRKKADEVLVVTPSKPTDEGSSNWTAVVGNDLPLVGLKKKPDNPYIKGNKRSNVAGQDDINREMGSFAKKMKDSIKSSGIKAQILLPGNEPEFMHVRIALLDFINPQRKFTHWLHRPGKWEEVFRLFAEDEEGKKRINLFLSYMTSVRLRDPAGNDIPETTTAKGRTGQLTLYRDVFMIVLPKALKNEDIPNYIYECFGPVFNDTEIQGCYHMQYMANSENEAADVMLSPIRSNAGGQNGKYWSMLEGALTDNSEIIEYECLSKLLTSKDIVTALETATGVSVTEASIKGKCVPEGVKKYVFGETQK